MLRRAKSWLRHTFRRSHLESDMDAELRFHIDTYTEDLIRSGVSRQEAIRRARIEFGGLEQTKEHCRDVTGTSLIESFLQDLRFGLRLLRKSPGFTTASILTLALGIGANTTIFSMVDWLLLRPLPVQHPEQLTFLAFERPNSIFDNYFSYPEFQDLRSQTPAAFADLTAYADTGWEAGPAGHEGLTVNGITKSVNVVYVSGNYFQMLGLRPYLGRLIVPSEGKYPGADPVIVLGYRYWKSRFAGDPSIVGKEAKLSGRPVTIAGVAAKEFLGATPIIETEGYLPLGMAYGPTESSRNFVADRSQRNLIVLARLKSTHALSTVQPVLAVIGKRFGQLSPRDRDDRDLHAYFLRTPGIIQGPNVLPVLALLFLLLALLVLVLACLNVANLVLVRAAGRAREMALRAALGAARGRLVRQVLSEGLLLALLGGAAGLLLGNAGGKLLSAVPAQIEMPFVLDFQTNWRVFAYAFAGALLSGLLVALVPAIRGSRHNLSEMLREGARGVAGGRQRVRRALVALQVAGSLMLLIVAVLFTRSLISVRSADLGYHPDHVLNLTINPHDIGFSKEQALAFYAALLPRVRAISGVESASLAATVPFGYTVNGDDVLIPGRETHKDESVPHALCNFITPGYLRTMGIALLAGRDFSDADNYPTNMRVALINEQFAKTFWPNQAAIGKQFRRSAEPEQPITVIGIVANTRTNGIFAPSDPFDAMFYQPLARSYSSTATLQVRTSGDPRAFVPTLVGTVNSVQPAMPVSGVRTMVEALDGVDGFFLFNLGAELAGCMGLLGLVLAVIGVFGVTSYAVSQRTHEIGVRMALGAQPGQVLRMIFRQGLAVIGAGIVLGLLAAFALSHLMGNFLVGVGPSDPVTYIAVPLLLTLVSLAACYVPARRAMRVDPMVALRYE